MNKLPAKASFVLIAFAMSLLTWIVSASIVDAQARRPSPKNSKPEVQEAKIFHTPPKLDTLPYPGQSIKLSAQLRGTRETDRRLRVIMIKDGSASDMTAGPAILDENDIPTYQLSLPAPLGEMVYQFLVYKADGQVLTSARYSLRRKCIPDVELAAGAVDQDVRGNERLQQLVNEAKKLENELINYEKVLNLIEQLQSLVKS